MGMAIQRTGLRPSAGSDLAPMVANEVLHQQTGETVLYRAPRALRVPSQPGASPEDQVTSSLPTSLSAITRLTASVRAAPTVSASALASRGMTHRGGPVTAVAGARVPLEGG